MRRVALLASLSAFVFLANWGGAHLWDEDEAIFSQTAREMLERGEGVVPYFNGEVFVHKPPMMYWLMEASYELLGTHAFAARFPSALFGLASVLLTYRLGRLMFSPGAGFWAGVILATNLNFMLIARAATPDAFLVFFSSLALLAFVSGSAKARAVSADPNERNAPWVGQNCFEPSWLTYVLSYAAMGLGVLVKGPIGVVLPTAVIGLFLLIVRSAPTRADGDDTLRGRLRRAANWMRRVFSPRQVLSTIWSMRPLTAIAVVLAVAAPWYAWVGVRTDGAFLVGFFGEHNFGRFLNAMENHRGPIFYYLVAMAVGFFPWSVLWGPCWLDMTRQLRAGGPWRSGYIFLCAWIAVWVGFFSLAGTKLPSYVVPAYPALALAAGCLVDRWLRGSAVVARIWTHLIWGTVALAGLAIMIALPIVAHAYLGNDWWLGAIGLVPLAGAALGWSFARRQQMRAALWTLTAVAA
ncbi:MAG TPA: glycosyltransferase family 39 protein, partial [Pirellulales bacterium]|nr:glycosyltransferase family 39 protein [Pirellulales bacterium]